MDPTNYINERVSVVALFKQKGDFADLCVPCKLLWRRQEITLTEMTLRHPTVAGKRMIHVFHATDGANGYRLEFDAESLTWVLVAMIAGQP